MLAGSRSRRRYLISVVALVTTLVLVACSDDADDGDDIASEPTPTPVVDVPEIEDDSSAAATPTPAEIPDQTEEPAEPEPGSPLADLNVTLEFVVDGFIQPTSMVPATDGTDRLFVVSRPGIIHVVEHGEVREEPFLDIQDLVTHEMVEQGLLNMTLHPQFHENRFFYLNYIDVNGNTMISRFEMSEDGHRGIRESEMPILQIEQPHYSHNGGNLKFGPDGYLYIGMGDGEDPGDPHGNAQDPSTLLGALLRIDVDGGDPYAIPPDNPFVGDEHGRDEIWAIGLRNPWRYSFDERTGDMYLVDVGQWAKEEINIQPADSTGGENYGWPIMEGDECWEAEECDKEGLTMPVVTYSNPDEGCAVIGGHAYYGERYPQMHGVYFFGDWCSGNIWGMTYHDGEWVHELLLESELMINSFGLDRHGELYVLDFDQGGMYRVNLTP